MLYVFHKDNYLKDLNIKRQILYKQLIVNINKHLLNQNKFKYKYLKIQLQNKK